MILFTYPNRKIKIETKECKQGVNHTIFYVDISFIMAITENYWTSLARALKSK